MRRGRAAWAGVVASQRGDNLWHAPLQRGLRGAAHLSAGNMMWSSSRLFGYSDIPTFPLPRAQSAPYLRASSRHKSAFSTLHGPRTAHSRRGARSRGEAAGARARCIVWYIVWPGICRHCPGWAHVIRPFISIMNGVTTDTGCRLTRGAGTMESAK